MRKNELTYLICGTISSVIGFILAKVYQIRAILYETEGVALEGVSSWVGTPIWKTVNENPGQQRLQLPLSSYEWGYFFHIS